MLWAPSLSSDCISAMNSAVSKSRPCAFSAEIVLFWQNTQRREQPVKKMAPLPRVPLTGGSSQKWSAARAMRSFSPLPQ